MFKEKYVAIQGKSFKAEEKRTTSFCLFKTQIWMKIWLFSVKITVSFFKNPDSDPVLYILYGKARYIEGKGKGFICSDSTHVCLCIQ